jgi:hypothetical protein
MFTLLIPMSEAGAPVWAYLLLVFLTIVWIIAPRVLFGPPGPGDDGITTMMWFSAAWFFGRFC